MNESNRLNGEPRDLDLSAFAFDEFKAFFFARRVVPDDEQYDYFLTDLRGEKYFESMAQVDQGIWGMWGANLRLYEFLFVSFRWNPA